MLALMVERWLGSLRYGADRCFRCPDPLHSKQTSWTAVRRSSIRNPVDTAGRTVRFPSHRLFDKPLKWFNPTAGFTTPDHVRSPDIHSFQIRPPPPSL